MDENFFIILFMIDLYKDNNVHACVCACMCVCMRACMCVYIC